MSTSRTDFSSSTPPEPSSGKGDASPYVITRNAQLKDLDGLADILADSFHSNSGLMYWIYPVLRMGIYEDIRSRFRSKGSNYVCLVAADYAFRLNGNSSTANHLAGTVEMALRSVYPWQPYSNQHLYISNLAVKAEYRRQGVARQLLNTCERIALEWGFNDLYLHVLENNHQARRLYFKAGYRLQQVDPGIASWLLGQPRRLFLHKHLVSGSSV